MVSGLILEYTLGLAVALVPDLSFAMSLVPVTFSSDINYYFRRAKYICVLVEM